ncbi:WAP four-disulfide core domain protein 3 [Tachyglossus aculeatus]|uniref:WAP four-disulfide core domain protein 3 n=1 Tax=Tachyglossus aculeatus TaxID=9261 RepID=UPI0018F36D6B|nr:WAP four-disulfide core domain protein 3 [Tachyglossus aculeatus]
MICSLQCGMKSGHLLFLAMVLSFRVLVSWGAVEQAKGSECAMNAVLCKDPCQGDESCPSGQKCCSTGCESTCPRPKPAGVEVP